MKMKIKTPNTIPRNWKSQGWKFDAWEDLNSGKAIEVESVPSDWKHLVEVEEDKSSTASKSSSKGGK